MILRSADELGETIRNNPFLQAGRAGEPPPCSLPGGASRRPPPSRRSIPIVRLRMPSWCGGSEIYLQCPNGVGNTKLTNAWFDSRLATISTGRNWRTVLKLFELAQGR